MDNITEEKNTGQILQDLLNQQSSIMLKNILTDLHPADIAEAMVEMDKEQRTRLLELIPHEKTAQTLINLDSHILDSVLEFLDESRLVSIISTMDSDDAADLLGELDEEIAHRVLMALPAEAFHEV